MTTTNDTRPIRYLLARREENFHDDSDFYAVVWNPETNRVERIETGTTRCAPYRLEYRLVDADDEIREKARQYWRDHILPERVRKELEADAAADLDRRRVKLVRARGDRKGAVGDVIWVGESRYGRGRKRAGIKTDDGRVLWADIHQFEPVYVRRISDAEVRRTCEQIAERNPRGYETAFVRLRLVM